MRIIELNAVMQDFITRELTHIKILSLCLIVWTHSLVIFPIFCAFKNTYFFPYLILLGSMSTCLDARKVQLRRQGFWFVPIGL